MLPLGQQLAFRECSLPVGAGEPIPGTVGATEWLPPWVRVVSARGHPTATRQAAGPVCPTLSPSDCRDL